MIELAPHHKYGLSLPTPVMPSAGIFGYGELYRDWVNAEILGAIVTHPISLRPRKAAHGQRLARRGEHFMVHTGLPNPGVKAVIRRYKKHWEQSPVLIIPHLIATNTSETTKAAAQLSAVRGVGGIELGLVENISADKAVALLHAAQRGSDLPIIARVPFSQVDTLAVILAEAGAEALTLVAPPRAVLPISNPAVDRVARFMRGRLYGPAVFPLLLNVLSRWTTPSKRKLFVPVIASGGITSPEDALACISLGATAVQVGACLWRDPTLLAQIAAGLRVQ